MSTFCHRFSTNEELPDHDVYLFDNMRGGKFYLDRTNYEGFVHVWCGQATQQPQPVTMDLAAAEGHALIFDIDFVDGSTPHPPGTHHLAMFPRILSTLRFLLLPHVKHFTYVTAYRDDGHGLHVHLPECVVGHDDYILLCEQLQKYFRHTFQHGTYHLAIPTHLTLSGGIKEGHLPYKPRIITYVDEKSTFELRLDLNVGTQLKKLKTTFKRVKDNVHSYFRQLIFMDSDLLEYLSKIMMPVPPFKPLYKMAFTTMISPKPSESEDYTDIAECVMRHTPEKLYVAKGKILLVNVAAHFLKSSHYLKLNAFRMTSIETHNHALRQWFERHYRPETHRGPTFPVFEELNNHLKASNGQLFPMENPIKTILEFNKGYFFLPGFYALCQCLHKSSVEMVQLLRPMLDSSFAVLLDRLEAVDEAHTDITMKDLTEQTIAFCGHHLGERFERHRDALQQVVENAKRAILSINSTSELAALIRSLQENHFPIRMLQLSNSLRKATPFIWNGLAESWQEMSLEKEKESHLINLWNMIKMWLQDYRRTGQAVGGPDDDMIQKFQISAVLSTISSDTSMERKMVQMDRHKWFIRTQDGLLDILTGHVGGTVPELFLSDRKMGIDIPRDALNRLINDCEPLVCLYELLTTKSFFQIYLKALFTDQTDNVWCTLSELVQERMPALRDNSYAITMMHFYVHLCKYTAFEYDLLMYLCDVLASIFIATNYERKFFVCKGQTSNGKSKLFELLGRMLGGYYHCIQSDNLKPGNASTNATPDLASTLFNCRIVTTEELEGKLNENRVKQITGNSSVAFRNMYEASQGGIPTAKLFTSTNNLPDCQSSEAFRDRVVAIPFLSRFVDKPPLTTSEQVRLNRYGKDEYVVEQSYVGCFLMLMYHLKKYMDVKDGLLHYRDAPPSVVEFTEAYLYNTDVYNQFKTNMDVQMLEDGMTTMTELRSAVRQFLKSTKNNTTKEAHLILKFEEEFKECRKLDETVGTTGYLSPLDVDEVASSAPPAKRLRVSDAVIYYENVVIRNVRRYDTNN